MRANSWLYHYYSVHSKIQYGLTGGQAPAAAAGAAAPTVTAAVAAAGYESSSARLASAAVAAAAVAQTYYPPLLSPYHHPHHPHHHPHHHRHPPDTSSPYLPPPLPGTYVGIDGAGGTASAGTGQYGSYHHHHHYYNHGGSTGYQPSSQHQEYGKRSCSPTAADDASTEPTKWRRLSANVDAAAVVGAPLSVTVPTPGSPGGAAAAVFVPSAVHAVDTRTNLRTLHRAKTDAVESSASESDSELRQHRQHESSVTPTNTEDVASWISLSASVNDDFSAAPVPGIPAVPASAAIHAENAPIVPDPVLIEKTQTFARLVQQYGSRLDDDGLRALERSVFGEMFMHELHVLGEYLRQGPGSAVPIPVSSAKSPTGSCNDSNSSRDSDYQSQTTSPPASMAHIMASSHGTDNCVMTSPYSSLVHHNHYIGQTIQQDHPTAVITNLDHRNYQLHPSHNLPSTF